MKTNEQENYNIFDDPDYLKADFRLQLYNTFANFIFYCRYYIFIL